MLLSLALVGAVAFLTIYVIKLDEANTRISEQNRQINDQKGHIKDQKELIDKKETFGDAMNELLDSVREFDGALMANIVPFSSYESVATQAWENRWDGESLDEDTETVVTYMRDLENQLSDAKTQASTNVTGTEYEEVTDKLGQGHVASLLDDADTLCKKEVLACVTSSDPYIVHFDAVSHREPHLNDWLRTGIAYHEFAHVLQFTNPTPTETAVEAFGGDLETMADCFALTYLDGWALTHRVWKNSNYYWDVSIGYGYTCNESQRQTIKDWYGELGFQYRPVSQ